MIFPSTRDLRPILAVFVLTGLGLAGGCTPDVDLPDIPEVATDGVLPLVAEQLETARKRVADRPRDAVAAGEYGMVLAAYNFSDIALVAYQRATLLAPRDFRWHYARGHLLGHLQRHDEALVQLQQAHELESGNSALNVSFADSLVIAGRLSEAQEIYTRELAANPKRPLAMLGLARVALAEERWADVLTELQPLFDAGINVREIFQVSGTALRQLGREQEAIAQLARFEAAGDLSIRQYDPLVRQISTLARSDKKNVAQARYLFESGDYPAAIAELKTAIEKNPDNAGVHRHLVFLYGETNDLDSARQHAEAARALGMEDAELEANWGYALRRADKLPEAIAAFETALALEAGNTRARMQLSYVLAQLGRSDEAITHLRKVLETEPRNRDARHLLGETLVRLNRHEEAVDVLTPALETEDERAVMVARALAAAQTSLGRYDDARTSLQRARQLAARERDGSLINAIDTDLQRLNDLQASD